MINLTLILYGTTESFNGNKEKGDDDDGKYGC